MKKDIIFNTRSYCFGIQLEPICGNMIPRFYIEIISEHIKRQRIILLRFLKKINGAIYRRLIRLSGKLARINWYLMRRIQNSENN
jgi:hypothetical protein